MSDDLKADLLSFLEGAAANYNGFGRNTAYELARRLRGEDADRRVASVWCMVTGEVMVLDKDGARFRELEGPRAEAEPRVREAIAEYAGEVDWFEGASRL